MKRLVLLALTAFTAWTPPAEARHCGHGRIYRVSMGICVSARSRLARDYVVRARRTIRYGHYRRYYRFALQQEEEGQGERRQGRRVKPKPLPGPARQPPEMLQVVEPLAEDTVVAVPYAISGSVLMRAPLKTFDWIKPE